MSRAPDEQNHPIQSNMVFERLSLIQSKINEDLRQKALQEPSKKERRRESFHPGAENGERKKKYNSDSDGDGDGDGDSEKSGNEDESQNRLKTQHVRSKEEKYSSHDDRKSK